MDQKTWASLCFQMLMFVFRDIIHFQFIFFFSWKSLIACILVTETAVHEHIVNESIKECK